MDKATLLEKLRGLLDNRTIIDKAGPRTDEAQEWIASVSAHLELVDKSLAAQFNHYTQYIVLQLSGSTLGPMWIKMQGLLRTAIARLELQIPQPQRRVYGPGDAYEIYRDLGTIMTAAKNEVFVVDPYANEEVFQLYLEKISARVAIRLLSGKPSPALKVVAAKFASRSGVHFEAKMSSDVHDRVIFVDSKDCWVLGQSIKDAASKKPTYLLPVDTVTGMLRLYEDAWRKATPY